MAIALKVTPGKRFQPTEKVTTSKLNLLGTPTVAFDGLFGPSDMTPGDYSALLQAAAYFYGLDTGGVNAAELTLTPAPPSLVDGLLVALKIANDSTGPCTLNLNQLGAQPVVKNGYQPLGAGDWRRGMIVVCRYRLDANIVPANATYDVAGNYILGVTQGWTYQYTPGNNDTQLTNGAQVLNGAGSFIAAGTTVTMTGLVSGGVTATVVPNSNVWQMLNPGGNLLPQFNHFRAASPFHAGFRGLVPGPKLGQQNFALCGDGTFQDVVSKAVTQTGLNNNAGALLLLMQQNFT